jgi:hypothetical protein
VSFDWDGIILMLSLWTVALGLLGFLGLLANWPHHR